MKKDFDNAVPQHRRSKKKMTYKNYYLHRKLLFTSTGAPKKRSPPAAAVGT
jgi:hypothetical protein